MAQRREYFATPGEGETSTSLIPTDLSETQTANQARYRSLRKRPLPTNQYDRSWIGVRQLGSGSQGRVGLWIKRDRNRNIVDNLCAKSVHYQHFWNNPLFWDDSTALPIEIYACVVLSSTAGVPRRHMVSYRGHRLSHTRQQYRLLMEYCPHGNLYDLIRKYWNLDKNENVLSKCVFHIFHLLISQAMLIHRQRHHSRACDMVFHEATRRSM